MAQVEIVIGSKSDFPAIEGSGILDTLNSVKIGWGLSIISAHRNDAELTKFCQEELPSETLVIIGVAGMAAALPGNIVAKLKRQIPVIGVALPSTDCPEAQDAVLSMTRTPPGTSLAFTGIGKSGLVNAALLASQIVGLTVQTIQRNLEVHVSAMKRSKPAVIGLMTSETPSV